MSNPIIHKFLSLDEAAIKEIQLQMNIDVTDITSIINCLEKRENLTSVFIQNEKYLLLEKLKFIDVYLKTVHSWLAYTFLPALAHFNNLDLQNCNRHLTSILTNLGIIRTLDEHVKTKCINKKIKNCDVFCAFCNKMFCVKTSSDWLEFENHDHIAKLLSTGSIFRSSKKTNLVTEINLQTENLNGSVNHQIELSRFCNKKVSEKLYPFKNPSVVCKTWKHSIFYTMRSYGPSLYQCLVCPFETGNEDFAYVHTTTEEHRNNIENTINCDKLLSFYEFFSSLPSKWHIHQVLFKPTKKEQMLFCVICLIHVHVNTIRKHIKTPQHKNRIKMEKYSYYHFYDEMKEMLSLNDTKAQKDKLLVADVNGTAKKNSSIDGNNQGTSKQVSQKSQSDSGKSKSNGKASSKKEDTNNKHKIVLAFNKNPKTKFEYLENRFQKHLDYIIYVNGNPHCTICMKNISNSIIDIRNHLMNETHKRLSTIPGVKSKYSYYCDVCYKYIGNERKWDEHRQTDDHIQRNILYNSNKNVKGGPYKEYECSTCLLVFFGNNVTVKRHQNESFGAKKLAKSKELKLPNQLINLLKNEQFFTDEIYKMSKESADVLKSLDLSWKCCKSIEEALKPIFGKCSAYPFGSRVSGLGNMTNCCIKSKQNIQSFKVYQKIIAYSRTSDGDASDLDVFVDIGSMYDGQCYQGASDQEYFVNEAQKLFKKHPDFSYVFAIPRARTPIVQVFHKVTDLDCDISFRHGLSIENTEFLRFCIDLQPKLKTLILFLKLWSKMCKLSERISTYALSMLSIYFFQVKKLLPSVKTIREMDPSECKYIAGWQTFPKAMSLNEYSLCYPPSNNSTQEILCNFYDFYSKFNFNMEVVCPLLGQTVLKTDFYINKGKSLPPEMLSYVEKINSNPNSEIFRATSPMCIQDPFDLSHNLTKASSNDSLKKFIEYCRLSFELLRKNKFCTDISHV